MSEVITPQFIILAGIVVFIAFAVRGLAGFGSGPVMVPLLLLFLDFKFVVPLAAIHAVLTGFMLLFTFGTKRHFNKQILLVLIPGGIIGIVAGAYILVSIESDLLKILFGLFIIAYCLKNLFWENGEIKEANEIKRYWGFIAGLLGGITGGLFSSGGPPIVIYLNRVLREKKAFRSTLVFYFLIHDSLRVLTYLGCGLFNGEIFKLSMFLLPAMIIGNLIGSLSYIRINQGLFNRIISLVLLFTGILLIFR